MPGPRHIEDDEDIICLSDSNGEDDKMTTPVKLFILRHFWLLSLPTWDKKTLLCISASNVHLVLLGRLRIYHKITWTS